MDVDAKIHLRYIGFGFLGFSVVLLLVLPYIFRFRFFAQPYYEYFILLNLLIFSVSLGIFLLFIGSSHKQIGQYLIIIGISLTIMGIMIFLAKFNNYNRFTSIFWRMIMIILGAFYSGIIGGIFCIIMGILNVYLEQSVFSILGFIGFQFCFVLAYISLTVVSGSIS